MSPRTRARLGSSALQAHRAAVDVADISGRRCQPGARTRLSLLSYLQSRRAKAVPLL